jgi:hypothetical protein
MSGVVIKSCTCSHGYQDKKYGPGLRVMNLSVDGKKYTCTVCGKQGGSK